MAVALDEGLALADVYAAALFSLAQESRQVDVVRQELEELARLQQREPAFAEFTQSDAIDSDRRGPGLEKMFRGRLSDAVLNTLLVMNRNGRSALLEPLCRCYVLRQEAAAGQVEASATTAVRLRDDEQEEVRRIAAEVSGKTPILNFAVDPGILGGLVLQIGDLRYDNSVRRQLEVARSRLLERAERGLGVGMDF